MEHWKDVVGYEGLYQVSDEGNVRSVDWGGRGYPQNLYLKKHKRGYYQIELSHNSKRKTFLVHRLVAEAFIPNPNAFPCVNHKDEIKTNNVVSNLEWCTYSYNTVYSRNLHPERICARKDRQNVRVRYGKRKHLSIEQVDKNGNVMRLWDNSRAIHLETGMSDWSISECCRGKRKSAYGYIWRYAN